MPRQTATTEDARPISPGMPEYPLALQQLLGPRAPAIISAIGSLAPLATTKLALLCSIRCPGDLIVAAYDLALELRRAPVAVVGGFHSPMEQECLTLLLRGGGRAIVCPARAIAGARLPAAWRAPLREGRLLVLSPFDERHRRVTHALAQVRNEFVAALADEIVVAHAEPGGRTAVLVTQALAWGKPVYALDSPNNASLLALGASPIVPAMVPQSWPAEN
jgi:predicted Rossmann fold nucleotide-binding protein DprA/Smf involved in DNA uptake